MWELLLTFTPTSDLVSVGIILFLTWPATSSVVSWEWSRNLKCAFRRRVVGPYDVACMLTKDSFTCRHHSKHYTVRRRQRKAGAFEASRLCLQTQRDQSHLTIVALRRQTNAKKINEWDSGWWPPFCVLQTSNVTQPILFYVTLLELFLLSIYTYDVKMSFTCEILRYHTRPQLLFANHQLQLWSNWLTPTKSRDITPDAWTSVFGWLVGFSKWIQSAERKSTTIKEVTSPG